MARNVLGSLVVRMGLDAAEYVSGLSKAEYQAKQFSDRLNRNFGSIGTSLKGLVAGLAAGVSVGVFVSLIKDSIAATAALEDMSAKTGVTVERLSQLSQVAKVGGFDFQSVGDAVVKLSKNMAAAQSPTSDAARAFASLGLSVTDSKGDLKNAGDFLIEFAKKLNTFGEGTGKTAVVLATLGRAGAEQLAFLRDLGNAGDLAIKTTEAQAAAAREYEKDLVRLGLQKQALVKIISIELVPVMDDFVKVLLEAQGKAGGLIDVFKGWAQDGTFKKWFEGVAIAVAMAADAIVDWTAALKITLQLIPTAIEQLRGLQLGFIGAGKYAAGFGESFRGSDDIANGYNKMTKAGREWVGTIREAANRESFASRVRKRFGLSELQERDAIEGATFNPKKVKPQVPFKPKDAAADAAAAALRKAQLDAANKALERAFRDEQDIFKEREHFLQAAYQDDQIGIAEYFQARTSIIRESATAEAKYLTEIIANQRRFADDARTDPKERVQAEDAIAEAIYRRGKAEREAQNAARDAAIERDRAAKQFLETTEGLRVHLSELQGSTVEAAGAAFDLANRKNQDLINANIGSPNPALRKAAEDAQTYLVVLRQLAVTQADLNKVTGDFARITERIGIGQSRIDLAQQTGAITEIDAINQKAQLARDSIAGMNAKIAEAASKIAEMPDGPVKDEAILKVEQMRLAVEQLAAQTDVLAKKFTDIFSGAFADALTELVSGTKKLKDVLKDMEKSIVGSINKIIAQNLSEKLFAKGGPLGGVGGFFADLFGGGKKAAVDASGAVTLTSAGTTLTTAGASLTTAAAALEAAAATLQAGAFTSGGSSSFMNLFGSGSSGGFGDVFSMVGMGGFFANGGNPPLGKMSVVGERGPEFFVPHTSGTIVPAQLLRGLGRQRPDITVINNLPSGASRATADQAALQTARAAKRATVRIG